MRSRPEARAPLATTRPALHAVRVTTTRERRQRLGSIVRQARKLRRLSQANLAKQANLSINVIGAIERGGTYSNASLDDVAMALGWPAGATDAYLRGDDTALDPRPAAPAPADTPVSGVRREILEASPDELVRMRALVEEFSSAEIADDWLQKAIRMREAHRTPQRGRELHAG